MATPEAADLALRKEVLLARSALCRLKIRYQSSMLRESVSWRRVGAAVAGSAPAREALFLLVAEGLGRYRVARWLALAARAIAVAKLASLAFSMAREAKPGTAEPEVPAAAGAAKPE